MQDANASSVKLSSHRNKATSEEVNVGVDDNSNLAIVTETVTVEEQHVDQMATVTWDNSMTMDWMEYIDNNLPETEWADLGHADFGHITNDPPSAPDLSNNVAGEQIQQSSARVEVLPSSTLKKEEPETAVACLSRLSHRLYSLYSEVLEMVNSPGALDPVDTTALNAGPFANDSAFQTLTGWLVRASSGTVDSSARAGNQENLTHTDGRDGCDVLQDVFSASQDLLNTLHSLNDESSKLSPYPVPRDSALPLDAAGLLTPQSMSMASNMEDVCSKKLPSSGHWSNSIVRHMVMACHMLLLNTYLAVTMALQHATDKQKPSQGASDIPALPLGEVRTVMMVQLCSYLIQRQAKAVQAYLAPPKSTESSDHSASHNINPLSSSDQAATKQLEQDLEQRLARLRKTLHIQS